MTSGLRERTMGDYLAALASATPTPGGGGAAAVAAALAAALGTMVVSVAQAKSPGPEKDALAADLQVLGEQLVALATEDEQAFAEVMDALSLAKEDPARAPRLQSALERASEVAIRAAFACVGILRALDRAESHASRSIVSDIGVAAVLAAAAGQAAILTARANLRLMSGSPARDALCESCRSLQTEAEGLRDDLVSRVEQRLAPRS